MADATPRKRSRFPFLFWLVVVFEFFERGSYYGVMSIFSVYLTDHLGFAKGEVGVIKSTIQPLLYFLPIISGALADRFGYRRTLLVAFALLGGGYFLTSQATSYSLVFLSLVVMGIGAGTFKPVISGTIARTTDETNSTLGFGIFYWSINLGAFLFPLILVPYLKNNIGWDWVLVAAAIGTASMLLPTLLLFREPPRREAEPAGPRKDALRTVLDALEIIYSPFVLLFSRAAHPRFRDHWRFLLMIFIYSGFWVLYFQMFDSVLWYVRDYVDASSLDRAVNGMLATVGIDFEWHFDIEHVTVINAGTIILLQLLISNVVKDRPAMPTMITGIALGTAGMAVLAISTDIWVFMAGTVIFSIGEMTAHPKFISYVGQTAPQDKVAMYMGYLFLYGVIGSSIGGILGANLYVVFVDELKQPATLWLIFSGIGVVTILGLLAYNRAYGGKSAGGRAQ
jgi:POT family proton-dependent oligopeptide transporter